MTCDKLMVWFGFMVFNATFNNILAISWRSFLLVEETDVPGENHQPVASHLRQVGGFFPGHPLFSSNKTDSHDITEILLKVALNTI